MSYFVGKNIAELKETLYYKATITSLLAVSTYAFFFLVSEVWIAVLPMILPNTAALFTEIAPLTTAFTAVGSLLNAVLFMSRSSIIRNEMTKLFRRSSSSNTVMKLSKQADFSSGAATRYRKALETVANFEVVN